MHVLYKAIVLSCAVAAVILMIFGCGDDAVTNSGYDHIATGPRLAIPDSFFNFGLAPQHSKISHVYWLYSTGDETVKILEIKPG